MREREGERAENRLRQVNNNFKKIREKKITDKRLRENINITTKRELPSTISNNWNDFDAYVVTKSWRKNREKFDVRES